MLTAGVAAVSSIGRSPAKEALLQYHVLDVLLDTGAMKVQQTELRQNSKKLMIFCAGNPNRSAAKNGIVSKHNLCSFKQERGRIRVGGSGVIEVRPVLDTTPG